MPSRPVTLVLLPRVRWAKGCRGHPRLRFQSTGGSCFLHPSQTSPTSRRQPPDRPSRPLESPQRLPRKGPESPSPAQKRGLITLFNNLSPKRREMTPRSRYRPPLSEAPGPSTAACLCHLVETPRRSTAWASRSPRPARPGPRVPGSRAPGRGTGGRGWAGGAARARGGGRKGAARRHEK